MALDHLVEVLVHLEEVPVQMMEVVLCRLPEDLDHLEEGPDR